MLYGVCTIFTENKAKYRKLENMMKIRYLYVFHTEVGLSIDVGWGIVYKIDTEKFKIF